MDQWTALLEAIHHTGPIDLCRLSDALQLHPDGQLIHPEAALLQLLPAGHFLLGDRVRSFHVRRGHCGGSGDPVPQLGEAPHVTFPEGGPQKVRITVQ